MTNTPTPGPDLAELAALSADATPGTLKAMPLSLSSIIFAGDSDSVLARVEQYIPGHGPSAAERKANGIFLAACWNYVRQQIDQAKAEGHPQ